MKTSQEILEILENDYEMDDMEISIYEEDIESLCLLLDLESDEFRDTLDNETGTIQIYIDNESISINCYFN